MAAAFSTSDYQAVSGLSNESHLDVPERDEIQQEAGSGTDICRDFLNNVCFRGGRCKYYHPVGVVQKNENSNGETKVMFCKDFLNQVCFRGACKYVHCTREEKELYEHTGRVSESLARSIVAATGQDVIDGRPLCKEFLSNHCTRGARCRFWHINPKQERELRMMGPEGSAEQRTQAPQQPAMAGYRASFDTVREFKRRAPEDEPLAPGSAPAYQRPRYETPQPPPPPGATNSNPMCEEIVSLRNRLDLMKQSLVDLMSQNDHLLAENARLRAKVTAANMTESITPSNILPINSMLSSNPASVVVQFAYPTSICWANVCAGFFLDRKIACGANIPYENYADDISAVRDHVNLYASILQFSNSGAFARCGGW
ncbi:hypothetical protein M513_02147 [Trichuris suis]|uniref:C3H1-type domain-containing protein n=1 Tax=Trichuris suis TaxID=68888 RepID=A0A085MI44_9BILA|nr:hypothetical protein M513_02147 [Trichuris suis]